MMNEDQYINNLLKDLNEVKVNGICLKDTLIFGKYNVWQFYQQRIYTDIVAFIGAKHDDAGSTIKKHKIKDLILNVIAGSISKLAFISALIRRPKVAIFSIDKISSSIAHNDFRMDEIYRFISKNNTSYVEIFHSILNRGFIDNLKKRSRTALYLKGIDVFYNIKSLFNTNTKYVIDESNLTHLSEKERKFIVGIINIYCYQINKSIFRVKVLKLFFRLTGIKVLFLIDDARNFHEVILGAKLANVSSFAFQHGVVSSSYVGWFKKPGFFGEIVSPDCYYVWSEYWKEFLIKSNAAFKKIEVGGFAKIPPPITKKISHDGLNILVPYEALAKKEQVSKYLKHFLECANTKLIFKIRPDRETKSQLNEYGFNNENHNVEVVSDTNKAIEISNVVVGTYSSFLYDMALVGLPIVILDTDIKWGDDMVDFGLATKISKEDNLCDAILKAAETDKDILLKRRLILGGDSKILVSNTLQNIAEKYSLIKK